MVGSEAQRDASVVFMSYAREDVELRELVESEVGKLGYEVWRDTRSLQGGEPWAARIDEALSSAIAVVLLITDASIESRYVNYEWAYAIGAGTPVVPLLCSSREMHPRLAMKHYLDFRQRELPWKQLASALEAAHEARPRRSALTPAEERFQQLLVQARTGDAVAAVRELARLDHPDVDELLLAWLSKSWRGDDTVGAERPPVGRGFLAAAVADRGLTAAVPELLKMLEKHPDVELIKALGELGDPSAIEPLADLTRRRFFDLARHDALLEALGSFRGQPAALDAVRDYLRRVRLVPTLTRPIRAAIRALGSLAEAAAEAEVVPFLDDPKYVEDALRALREMDGPRAGQEIATRLLGLEPRVHREAIEALSTLGYEHSADTLSAFILSSADGLRDQQLSVQAAGTLAQLGQAGASKLREALRVDQALPRAVAAEAIRYWGAPDLSSELGKLLEDHREVEALHKLEFVYGVVRSGSYVRDTRVSLVAREALLSIGTPEALQLLESLPPAATVD